MITVICDYGTKTLIKKYNRFYIRFMGGSMHETPCDISITKTDAVSIMQDSSEMDAVFEKNYSQLSDTSADKFINLAIRDYLFYTESLSLEHIERVIKQLEAHPKIRLEFFEVITYGRIPKNAVNVIGFTADELMHFMGLNLFRAYDCLMYLSDKGGQALGLIRENKSGE